MRLRRFVLACITLVGTPIIACAAPGDPRLVNGVLEWPRTVTNEPFVIVRGDDGVLYYVGLGAVRRDGTVNAGARVSVLGIEGRNAHEITAVGFGTGATTEAALAQLSGGRTPAAAAPPATVAAPAAPATAPAATPTPPAATAAAPAAPTVAAPASTPAANGAASAPAANAAAPAATAPAAIAPKPAAPAAAPTVQPTPSGTATAPAPTPAVAPTPAPAAPTSGTAAVTASAPTSMPPGVVPTAATTPAPTHPPIAATAPMVPVDDRRWTEVSGEIEAIVGRTVLLKVDGGRVTVDVSSLSGNLERMVGPGSKVKFYGVPVELRFKAMGFIDPDARGRAR